MCFLGYDLEDAMIINKSSFERGFCHGSVYKSEKYEIIAENIKRGEEPGKKQLSNKNPQTGRQVTAKLQSDGLP